MISATPATANQIARNWRKVNEAVQAAAAEANRDVASVKIVGVTKYVDAALARQLVDAGCNELGESRPQELWHKHAALSDLPRVHWHQIGHLQRNKIRRTLPMIDCLHSLDNWPLAQSLSGEEVAIGGKLDTLLEVNVTLDRSKTGLCVSDLPNFVEQVVKLPGLHVRGLMAMSSREATQLDARREFAEVRRVRDMLQARFGAAVDLSQLSMGMSGDFHEAILEGATMVRIGSSLWEGILDS